jgi:hypothetical protein
VEPEGSYRVQKSLPLVLMVETGKYEEVVMKEVMQREAGGCNCDSVNERE